jgi:DNA-binding GntR family transcriptional regulator
VRPVELAIDVNSIVYPYVQIADQLRAAIAGGETVAGVDTSTGKVPSYWDIVKETGCAYNTARRAMKILIDEGLVVARPGRGTFVKRDGAT